MYFANRHNGTDIFSKFVENLLSFSIYKIIFLLFITSVLHFILNWFRKTDKSQKFQWITFEVSLIFRHYANRIDIHAVK